MLDPVLVAWRSQGPAVGPESAGVGRCCRCGRIAPVTPVCAVVSAKFTAWDQLTPGDGLCQPCAWAYTASSRLLMLAIHETRAEVIDTATLFDHLMGSPRNMALVVPISGRKHNLPHAQWGTIRIDNINLVWHTGDVTRLQVVGSLRSRGLPAAALADPSPPWSWIATQPAELRSAALREWDVLAPWRGTPHMQLAIKATSHLKGPRP